LLYREFTMPRRADIRIPVDEANSELVDPTLFWRQGAQISEFLLRCSINIEGSKAKILLAKFSERITLAGRAEFVRFARRAKMAWKTPKIVEVPVGMEINMYMCAARK
jgi:coenzyme PQQ precursor peptide PqqA